MCLGQQHSLKSFKTTGLWNPCFEKQQLFFTQQETWKSNYQGLAVHEAFATSFIIIQSAMLYFCCLLIKIQSVSKLDGTLSSWVAIFITQLLLNYSRSKMTFTSKQWGIVTVLRTQSVQLNRSSEQKANFNTEIHPKTITKTPHPKLYHKSRRTFFSKSRNNL